MNFILSWQFFAIATAIYIGLRYIDINSSRNFPFTGQTESFWFSRDKYGFFDTTRNVIASSVIIVLALLMQIFMRFDSRDYPEMGIENVEGGFGWLLYLGAGIGGFLYGMNNSRKAKINREKQKQYLLNLDYYFVTHEPIRRAGRTFYLEFGWLFSEIDSPSVALLEVESKIREFAASGAKFPR